MLTVLGVVGTYIVAAWGYALFAWMLGAPLGVVVLVYIAAKMLGK